MNYQDLFKEDEKPLEKLIDGVGFCGIFRTIACVGDSLSSGEFQTLKEDGSWRYADRYAYSWGQFLGREIGSKVYNFSQGGMTARTYCETFADNKDFWNKELIADAYIIALGVNDLHFQKIDGELIPFGTTDDIDFKNPDNNAKTFIGYYARIIQKYKGINPDAKFFLMTMPITEHNGMFRGEELSDLLYKFAEIFDNTYVLDFMKYAPAYDSEFKEKFYLNGHMNACGYMLTAQMVKSYIDYIIRHNMDDFRLVGIK
jgi:lysophospholipase L1-like esterase